MKLLLLLLFTSCSTVMTVYDCADTGYNLLKEDVKVSKPGDGILTNHITLNRGCDREDIVNLKAASVKREN